MVSAPVSDASLAALHEASREAAQLLGLLAFLAPEPVPLWLFAGGDERLPSPLSAVARAGEAALGEPARRLEERGLAEPSGEAASPGLRVPEEVARAIRERMTGVERARFGATAVALLADAFPDRVGRPEDRGRCQALVPHARAAARRPGAGGRATGEAVHLLARVGAFQRMSDRAPEARDTLAEALRIAGEGGDAVEGPLHAAVADELATTHAMLGETDAARRAAGRALDLAREHLPPTSPHFPILLANIATTLREADDHAAAADCLRRAIAAAEEAGSPAARPLLAELHLGLADAELSRGRHEEAGRAAARALRIAEERFGERHALTARAVWILADARRAAGERASATELYRRGVALQEELRGPEHASVGQKAWQLGLHLEEAGDRQRARELYGRALAILERHLDPGADALRSLRACLARVREGPPDRT